MKIENGVEGRQAKGIEKMEDGAESRQAKRIKTKQADLEVR